MNPLPIPTHAENMDMLLLVKCEGERERFVVNQPKAFLHKDYDILAWQYLPATQVSFTYWCINIETLVLNEYSSLRNVWMTEEETIKELYINNSVHLHFSSKSAALVELRSLMQRRLASYGAEGDAKQSL
jgi:hypothetical protein